MRKIKSFTVSVIALMLFFLCVVNICGCENKEIENINSASSQIEQVENQSSFEEAAAEEEAADPYKDAKHVVVDSEVNEPQGAVLSDEEESLMRQQEQEADLESLS